MSSTLLYVLTFLLFLTIPGGVTGTIFLASTVGYFVLAVYQSWRRA